MTRRKLISVAIAVIIALGVAYACYDFYRIPLVQMTVYATLKDSPAWKQSLATYRLKLVSHCPSEHFSPATPLSFLVAAMDSVDTDLEQAKGIFRHFQKTGCDINAVEETGLRPLHAAILFRNASLVSYLLENGADAKLRVEPPAKQAGKDGFQWAEYVCVKNNDKCVEIKNALEKKI